jgi:large repetitive protein
LPAGLTYVSDNGAGAYISGTGVWTVGTIAFPGTATLEITALVTTAALPSANNIATITASDQYDPVPANNTDNQLVTPQQADLAITKTVNNATPNVGDNVTFTITVTNNGPDAATGVQVTDQLPAGLTYVSDNGAGAYISGTGVWTVGTIAFPGTATLEITALVTTAALPSANNIATITASDQYDPVPANDTATQLCDAAAGGPCDYQDG